MGAHAGDFEESVARGTEFVIRSRYLVALVGAGLSVESGIPPFRGPGGLWERFGEPGSLSYQSFVQDPSAWWERWLREEVEPGTVTYELARAVESARPNAGHLALAELERMGVLKYVITQNVDNLYTVAGSVNVAEIHGNRTKVRCLQCGLRLPRSEVYIDVTAPACPECGGVLKMDTVMFGEPIPQDVMAVCTEQVAACDCMLMIGTSGTVRPAAIFPQLARYRGATLIEVNPHETALTAVADVVLRGPSGEVLPTLVTQVRRGREL